MQEDAAVAPKEMSLRRTFCLQFAIVILVQQRIFVCAGECTCRCNERKICDQIKRLETTDHVHYEKWKTWHRDFDHQDWTHRITEVEKEVKNIEVLKGRLMQAESLATRLETVLKNDKKEFETKLDEFEKKLQDVQSQAGTQIDPRPGFVELEHVNVTVKEDSGTLQVNVIRIGGTDGLLNLKYKTLDVSAAEQLDYVPVVGDLVFKDGERKKIINILIVNDDVRESLEAFQLQIFDITPGPGTMNFRPLGTNLITHITIIDDDARPGYVELEHVNVTLNEDSGTLQVNVIRIGGTDGILNLKYKTLDFSAVAELDYVPVVGDLVFKDGESKRTIIIFILNDDVRESLEAFQLQIFDITPGPGIFNFRSLGTKLITTITIIDDEHFYEPCGTNPIERETNMTLVSRITNATEGTWPWMAVIQRKSSTGSFTHWCTGFLIDKKHVVSVAQYFRGEEPHMYRVLLGSVNREAGEEYTITRIVVPRGQTGISYYDDIAILTLSRNVGIPNFVPVCLPDNGIINKNLTGTGTTVAGWTVYAPLNRLLMQLSGVTVPSNEECETLIRELPRGYPSGLTTDIFCARSERDCGGVCWIDMGSILMLLDRNRWYAVGIFSTSVTCEPSNWTGLYTRVTSYSDWITENTRD